MKIISANLNGIRSASTKGFFEWLASTQVDVLCVQEIKAHAADLTQQHTHPAGLQGWFHHAEKKGYSGVGLYSRSQPVRITTGFGVPEFDNEGRYIEAEFEHTVVISVSGSVFSASSQPTTARQRSCGVR
jgi:exodeoxyribonuclease-3